MPAAIMKSRPPFTLQQGSCGRTRRYFKDRDTRLPRVWNMNLMLTVPHATLWQTLLPDARVIHYTIFKASARCGTSMLVPMHG